MDDIKYDIILSRRRSISIIVRPDKSVIVRAPLRTPVKVIEKFVQSKSSWIRKHINSEPGIRLTDHNKKFTGGDIFLFLGKEFKLKIIATTNTFVTLNEDRIEVGQKDPDKNNVTRLLISRWYLLKAKEILTDKLNENLRRYSEYKFVPAGLVIRQLKSRWGSCSSRGRITLNSELIKLDPRIIDYVIMHELCHIKFHNHGPDFHRLLGELVPDYKLLRKELRKYIPGLLKGSQYF